MQCFNTHSAWCAAPRGELTQSACVCVVVAALLLYFSSSPMHPHWCARKTLLSLPSTTRVKAEARFSWCALLLSFAKGNIFNTARTHTQLNMLPVVIKCLQYIYLLNCIVVFSEGLPRRFNLYQSYRPKNPCAPPQTCCWCSLHISQSVLLKYVNPWSYKFNSCPASDHILKSVGF